MSGFISSFVIWNVCMKSGLQSSSPPSIWGFSSSVCNLLWHVCYCSNQLVEKEEKLMNLSAAFPYSVCLLEFVHGHFIGSISVLWFCHLWNDIHNGVQQYLYCREHHQAFILNMLISQYRSFFFFRLLGYICFYSLVLGLDLVLHIQLLPPQDFVLIQSLNLGIRILHGNQSESIKASSRSMNDSQKGGSNL